KFAYKRMKENNAQTCANFRTRIAELKSVDSGFKEYIKYNISLMSNLKQYYSTATLDSKQKMLGLMFPEKLVFSNNEFQTTKESELLTLLCNAGKGFSGSKKEKSSGNAAQSYVVTALGFKPKTF
ncbi:MAG: hypothetical protein ABIW38_09980, partial [Ferruginibacter sp.]